MDNFGLFTIPIKGLLPGVHVYNFDISDSFFKAFEESSILRGSVSVELELDRKTSLLVTDWQFSGQIKVECDRCLAEIALPISGSERLLFKMDPEEKEEEADVVYISPEAFEINVAQYVYEMVSLAVPMVRLSDCEERNYADCDKEVLGFFIEEEDLDPTEDIDNPFAKALKDFKQDNNN